MATDTYNYPVYRTRGDLKVVATGTTITANLPAGWEDGDDCYALVSTDNTGTITASVGWTELATQTVSTTFRASLFYRRLQTGDTAPTFTAASRTGTQHLAVTTYGFINTNRTTPHGTVATTSGTGTSITVPTITFAGATESYAEPNWCEYVVLCAKSSSGNFNDPSSADYYEMSDQASTSGGGVGHDYVGSWTETGANSGSSTVSYATSAEWVSFGFAQPMRSISFSGPTIVSSAYTGGYSNPYNSYYTWTVPFNNFDTGWEDGSLCLMVVYASSSNTTDTSVPTITDGSVSWNSLTSDSFLTREGGGKFRAWLWWCRKPVGGWSSSPTISYQLGPYGNMAGYIFNIDGALTTGTPIEGINVSKELVTNPVSNIPNTTTVGNDRAIFALTLRDYGGKWIGPNHAEGWWVTWYETSGTWAIAVSHQFKPAPTAGTYTIGNASFQNFTSTTWLTTAMHITMAIAPDTTTPPKTKNHYVKDAGAWKQVDTLYTKDSGVWKEPTNFWTKDSGVWKKVYGT